MDSTTRQIVRERAGQRCEYCRIPQAAISFITFHVEHIIARQRLQDDRLANLALACDRCNAFKGLNLTSIEPETGEVILLFHTRRDDWDDHFQSVNGLIVGLTPIGKVTVQLLQINDPQRVELREIWASEAGEF